MGPLVFPCAHPARLSICPIQIQHKAPSSPQTESSQAHSPWLKCPHIEDDIESAFLGMHSRSTTTRSLPPSGQSPQSWPLPLCSGAPLLCLCYQVPLPADQDPQPLIYKEDSSPDTGVFAYFWHLRSWKREGDVSRGALQPSQEPLRLCLK